MNARRTTAIFALLAAPGMTAPAYSQDRGYSIDGNAVHPARDMQVEYLDRSQMEESRWNTYLDESGRRRMAESQQDSPGNDRQADSVAARLINHRPELGCLFYDENDIRHWQPNCHE